MVRLWGELDELREGQRRFVLREPDLGFAWARTSGRAGRGWKKYWAIPTDPGDFVRAVKQLIDLLDQIAARPRTPAGRRPARRHHAIRRGVVAYSSVT